MFKRILIANRGEIAVRIIRACMEMNIECVAIYSTADKESLDVKLATKSICIGPARAADSYLNMDAIITAAQVTGCDALHPGFGFLSENSDFVRKCQEAGITFIGPTADAMDALGNKATARKMMMKAGVPVVPGSDGPVEDFKKLEKIAKKIGYPVLIKASAGGGGRGMRRVYHPEDLKKLYEEAKAETRACFNDDEMYVEKLILNPRHIEFQILADEHGNVIHLGERDCSIQRKNQKLIEESPCMYINDDLRKSMGKAAVTAAKAAGYTNAGTVEFVIDGDTFVFKNKEGIESRIRMIGIDAPESASHIESQNTEAGRLATEFVKSNLEGKRVGLEYDVQTTDRYGRTLAYVWLDGELFNKRVLEEGHAELLIIPPNEKYSDYLEDLSSN